jgi:hypothetical protein
MAVYIGIFKPGEEIPIPEVIKNDFDFMVQ